MGRTILRAQDQSDETRTDDADEPEGFAWCAVWVRVPPGMDGVDADEPEGFACPR